MPLAWADDHVTHAAAKSDHAARASASVAATQQSTDATRAVPRMRRSASPRVRTSSPVLLVIAIASVLLACSYRICTNN
ncbi:MAG TPA: hypothetical protein DD645_06275 [Olsenella sp.]|nr:hypothetical protein [Olsenella sp.]